MSRIAFHLNGVPEEEINDVRTLLDDAGIEYYETSAGRWGISTAAIWIRNDDDFEAARAVIEQYQQELQQKNGEQPMMTIGPAPIIKMLLMSVRLAMMLP